MAGHELTGTGAQAVLCASVAALLSAGVGSVLLAVTESVLWPLFVGVGWVVVAAGVVVEAEVATRSRSGTRPASLVPLDAVGPVPRW